MPNVANRSSRHLASALPQSLTEGGTLSRSAFTFVFPSLLNGRLFQGFDYHLGAGYIRAYLAQKGIPTEQFVDPGEKNVTEIAARILARRPELIGFSCYDNNYHLNRLLACEIRRQCLDVPVVFGGPSATFSDRLILSDCPAVDICCRSYSEETALDLVRWSNGQITLDAIPGVTYRQGDEIIRNLDRALPPRPRATLDAAAPGDRVPSGHASDFRDTAGALDLYPDPYVTGFLPPGRVSDIGLVTSRGCTFACTFCNFAAMSGRSLTAHSLAYVMDVFRFLDEAHDGAPEPTLVTINDDNFSLHGKRFHALLLLMASASFKNLSFWAEMRAETLQSDSFRLLRSAGFREINFGLESAVPHVLAAMKKVRSSGWESDDYAKERAFLERIAWAVRESRSAGIKTTVSVILGGPAEKLSDGQRTLDYVVEIGADSYAHNFMAVGAGTELGRTYGDWGLVVESPPDRVLPFVTHVTYDVYQLRVLEHDRAWLPMTGFEMRQASLLFTGIGSVGQRCASPRGYGRGGLGRGPGHAAAGTEHTRPAPVIGITDAGLDAELAGWLAEVMPIAASLWLIHTEAGAKRNAQAMLNRAGVPVQELNTLRLTEAEPGTSVHRVNELAPGAPAFNTRTIRTVQVGRSCSADFEKLRGDKRAVLHYAIETPEDVGALLALAPESPKTGEWLVEPEFVAARVTFQDACRWCSSECPATHGKRWLVSSDKAIRPCLNGGPVGRVGDTPEQLIGHAETIQREERLRRGCSSCVANDTCAKCLFPHPVSVEEYCRIQRQRPALRGLIDGLSLARSMLDNHLLTADGGPLRLTSLSELTAGSFQVRGTSIPLSSCVLLDVRGNRASFIYSHRFEYFAGLPREESEALRALLPRPDVTRVGAQVGL